MHDTPRRLITTRQAAEILGVSIRSVQRLVAGGSLTSYEVQGVRVTRLDSNEVMSLFSRTRRLPSPPSQP